MIHSTLSVLANVTAEFIRIRTGATDGREVVTLSATNGHAEEDVITLSLISIEEERIHSPTVPLVRKLEGGGAIDKVSPLQLSLLVLFAARFNNYVESLKRISDVLECFRTRQDFSPENTHGIDAPIERILLSLHNLNLNEASQMWTLCGGHYVPSLVYRVRVLASELGRNPRPSLLPISADTVS